MIKFLSFGIGLWLTVFALRILSIGGLDPTYRDSEVELFKPLRDKLVSTIDILLPYPQSSLLSGILLGSQERLPVSLKEDLKTTSTIHMVVVSGQNLTMLAGLTLTFTPFLGRRKTIIMTSCVIVFYSLLTGLQVPVLRATIMAGAAYLGQLLGKEKVGWWVLLITAGGMLFYNPNWLLSISFQLSFLATLGVVVISPLVIDYLKFIPNLLRQDLGVTLSAQALVLPVIAYNFNQLSLVGVLANLLILWTIPIVMASGLISLVIGLFSTFLGQIAGLVPGVLLTYFISLVEIFAKIPGASFKIGTTGVVVWVGYYLMIGAAVWEMRKGKSTNF